MSASTLPVHGRLARGAHPEREDKSVHAADEWVLSLRARLQRLWPQPAGIALRRMRAAMGEAQPRVQALDDDALRCALRAVAAPAVRDLQPDALHRALVLVAEVARRTLGMTPYPTQLLGAAALLQGRLAKMHTGEGKTLTAGVAACLAGVAGVPVHVVTVNDYLARRDAEKTGPLHAFMGLRVGVVVSGQSPADKRAAYRCDIAYCTNKDLVFDYLRDRVDAGGRATGAQMQVRRLHRTAGAEPLLRGLHFAIVDEADSILIDEARTPLILAEKAGPVDHAEAFPEALALAQRLLAGIDFELVAARRAVHLLPAGRSRIAALAAHLPGPWAVRHAREHLVVQALRALHLYQRDRQYLVDDDGLVQIIDEYTGRVLPGRTWEQGLHQMVEAKEGRPLSEQTRTLARITYQRFFTRYLRLAGMTGTGREVAHELAVVYRLCTTVIPTHRPSARRSLPSRLCADQHAKWGAVADAVAAAHARGQPVLVGTRSVEASERLSQVLAARALPHRVLNARQDAEEAAIVEQAGRRGAITVATNMAGRGTDIALGDGVAALGGLMVVLTEYHESPRIDRQFTGRCARQGDPGLALAVVAADDELLRERAGLWRFLLQPGAGGWRLAWCRRQGQAAAERQHARTRRDTLRQDRKLDNLLAFSGEAI